MFIKRLLNENSNLFEASAKLWAALIQSQCQSSPFDECDSTRTPCHTGKISYECDLSHGQDKTFLKFQEIKLFTSNLSLVIFKKRFTAMASIQAQFP